MNQPLLPSAALIFNARLQSYLQELQEMPPGLLDPKTLLGVQKETIRLLAGKEPR